MSRHPDFAANVHAESFDPRQADAVPRAARLIHPHERRLTPAQLEAAARVMAHARRAVAAHPVPLQVGLATAGSTTAQAVLPETAQTVVPLGRPPRLVRAA